MKWLTLMYITNNPKIALMAEEAGVDRIWIDLETLGKAERQPGNTVKSHHTIDDIRKIKPLLTKAKLICRVNPWNPRSVEEINAVIDAGADIVMLPMWKTVEETQNFLKTVNGRAKTMLLLETKEGVEIVDEVLKNPPDEIHIGLNDLHLSYNLNFMFEPLANGMVENLCRKFKAAGIPYGFGGIARLGHGTIKADRVICEHRRLGSSIAILSRSFCDANTVENPDDVRELFKDSMHDLFLYEDCVANFSEEMLEDNRQNLVAKITRIADGMQLSGGGR